MDCKCALPGYPVMASLYGDFMPTLLVWSPSDREPVHFAVDRHERPPRSSFDAPRQGTAERTAHTVRHRFIDSRVGPLVRAAIMFSALLIGIVAVPAIASAQDASDADDSSSGSTWMVMTQQATDDAPSDENGDDGSDANDDGSTDDNGDASDDSEDAGDDTGDSDDGANGVIGGSSGSGQDVPGDDGDEVDDADEVVPNAKAIIIMGIGHDDDDGDDDGAGDENGNGDENGDEDSNGGDDGDTDEPSEPIIDVESITSFLPEGQSLADYAALFGLTPEQLVDALLVEFEAQLDLAVENGDITQDEADELLVLAQQHLAELIDASDDGDNGDDDPGEPGDPGDPGDETPQFNVEEWVSLDVVADLTGTTTIDVQAALDGGTSLVDFAAQFGVSEDELVNALVADIEAQINAAVDAGDLTQDVADQYLAELDAAVRAYVGATGDDGTPPDDGSGDDGGDQPGDDAFDPTQGALDVVASLTGTTVDEVQNAVMGGQSLVEFAADHGVTEDQLVAAVTADVEAQIIAALDAGDISQDEANTLLANIDQIVEAFVNATDLGEVLSSLEDDPAAGNPVVDPCEPMPMVDGMSTDGTLAENVCPAAR